MTSGRRAQRLAQNLRICIRTLLSPANRCIHDTPRKKIEDHHPKIKKAARFPGPQGTQQRQLRSPVKKSHELCYLVKQSNKRAR